MKTTKTENRLSGNLTSILVAAIAALGALGAAYISGTYSGKEQGLDEARRRATLQVSVFDASSSAGVPQAAVRVTGEGITESRETDSTGRVTIQFSLDQSQKLVQVEVDAATFKRKREELQLSVLY